MNDEELIQLLRMRRHDDLNDFQLVTAYLAMDRKEEAKETLSKMVYHIRLEQELFSLSIHKFALFILQFNFQHRNSRFTYDINIKSCHLGHLDHNLCEIGHHVSTLMKTLEKSFQEHPLHVSFQEASDPDYVTITFVIDNVPKKERDDFVALICDTKLKYIKKVSAKHDDIIIEFEACKHKR